MTQENGSRGLDRAIRAMKEDAASPGEISAAAGRLSEKLGTHTAEHPEIIRGCDDVRLLLTAFEAGQLPTNRAMMVQAHLRDCLPCRLSTQGQAAGAIEWAPAPVAAPPRRWMGAFTLAAAAVLIICAFFVHNTYFAIPAGARATVQSIDGAAYRVTSAGDQSITAGTQLYEGELLRTSASGHAFVKLSDGSVVEVGERSEFSLKARGKDATIALDRGAVIVQAAKRTSGHLYVKTPDCRVAVTGTVFSVNSGMKGSRISVVEGTVEVAHGGSEDVLHSGDQVSTGTNMSPLPVQEDIAWSQNLPEHLELLAQFSKLQRRLEQVSMPAPRYSSQLMGRMPADTIFFASLPNAGQALEDAHKIMQSQIQQSAALREWWNHGDPQSEAKIDEVITKVRALSDYVGEEIVIVGFGGKRSGVAVVATLRRSDIKSFLETQFAPATGDAALTTITEDQLPTLAAESKGLIALVRQNEVVFGTSRDALQRVNAQLNSGTAGLADTEFGQRLQGAYNRGAGFLLAADLHKIMAADQARARARNRKGGDELVRSGLADMRYLVLEHRELSGVPENRMALDFAGERKGIASWLAAPAPMGSLEFVSRNAAIAVAFVAKEPELMLTDILNMASNKDKQQTELAEAEAKLNVRIREDLAAHFGGDGAFALDGPVLPTPSWKVVIEVHDAPGLVASLSNLAQGLTREAESRGKAGVDMKTEQVDGQSYYTIRSRESGAEPVYFTFAAGYMVMGPNRAVVMNTLRTRATGDSLARSGEFKALLPKDENANYSVIAYQNLAPILQPLLSQMTGEQGAIVQQLAADSRPSVICAWGRQNQIEAVTNSRLLGFDWLAAGSLLNRGTGQRKTP